MIIVPRLKSLAAVSALALFALLGGCGTIPTSSGSSTPLSSSSEATVGPEDPVPETCEYVASGEAAKKVSPPKSTGVEQSGSVTFDVLTNEGDVSIAMNRAKAPCTINSFESLADQGFYNDTKCHRLVDSSLFVLQCGDPTGTGSGGPGYSYADETDESDTYPAGTVAMANAGPNTNGSQFILVYEDTQLPPSYTVFGRMDDTSREVVARIATEGQDGSNPDGSGKPNNPAEMITVTKE